LAIVVATAPAFAALVLAESPPPTAPFAAPDSYAATEDHVLLVAKPGVLANDPGTSPCVVSVDPQGLVGTVEFLPDGSLTYTPPPNFNGETSFTYRMRFTGGERCLEPADSQATVTINVAPENDAPTATNDSFQVLVGRTLNVRAPGVLVNDHDVDGDPLTASLVTGVSHGTLVLASNGSFAYTPAAGYLGPDGFSYRASDGSLTSPVRVVSLSVIAVPTPIPTLAPTPTLTPTPTPTVEPTTQPTLEPTLPELTPIPTETAAVTLAPLATLAPSPKASAVPGATRAPSPTAGSRGGLSLPLILVIVLFAVLVAFGAALYVPRWLNTARTGESPDDD